MSNETNSETKIYFLLKLTFALHNLKIHFNYTIQENLGPNAIVVYKDCLESVKALNFNMKHYKHHLLLIIITLVLNQQNMSFILLSAQKSPYIF